MGKYPPWATVKRSSVSQRPLASDCVLHSFGFAATRQMKDITPKFISLAQIYSLVGSFRPATLLRGTKVFSPPVPLVGLYLLLSLIEVMDCSIGNIWAPANCLGAGYSFTYLQLH